jgi:glycolate oxidase FAD binding subunit
MTASALPAPATTTAELRDHVRDAVARRRALRITGRGSWLDANRPVSDAAPLSTRSVTGIVEYVPGDLTLTARAGTTLDEIARATAAHDQWLALDPVGDPTRSTIGATVATASYGPLAHHFGTPRDMTLGLEFVTGKGDVVRGGGRVVKNVAGFDLTRLLTGSWGSLGVITEVTVRLRALPAVQCTVAIDATSSAVESIEHLAMGLRRLPFVPFSAQLLHPASAEGVGASSGRTTLLLRIGGNGEAVQAQRHQLAALGEVRDAPDLAWDTLRAPEPTGTAVVRLSHLASRFAETWFEAVRLVEAFSGYCHGDPGRGVVRCVFPIDPDDDVERVHRSLSTPFVGTRVFERLPAALWALVAPSAVADGLSRRIKRAFDPANVLNPGILGEAE